MKVGSVIVGALAGIVAAAATAIALRKKGSPVSASRSSLVGDLFAHGLASPLRSLGLNFELLADSGSTVEYWTKGGLARLQAELAKKPSSVFVSLGMNDAFNGEAYATMAGASTNMLLAIINRAGGLIFWIGPPSLPSYGGKLPSQAVIDAIRQVVENTPGATWIDSSTATIARQSGGLHPTLSGYYYWADLLVDDLAGSFVSPTDVGQAEKLGEDSDEPFPRPRPPSVVVVPTGWVHTKTRTPATTAFAVAVLAKRKPIGDLEINNVEGVRVGALTEWHWDNHVGGEWKWHRGISLLVPSS
jgi:lysophospholipase L1-like esterase